MQSSVFVQSSNALPPVMVLADGILALLLAPCSSAVVSHFVKSEPRKDGIHTHDPLCYSLLLSAPLLQLFKSSVCVLRAEEKQAVIDLNSSCRKT